MNVMGLTDQEQSYILQVVAGILHLGNVTFVEKGNYSEIQDCNGEYSYIHKNRIVRFILRFFSYNISVHGVFLATGVLIPMARNYFD
jgi:hypothetical protein